MRWIAWSALYKYLSSLFHHRLFPYRQMLGQAGVKDESILSQVREQIERASRIAETFQYEDDSDEGDDDDDAMEQ